ITAGMQVAVLEDVVTTGGSVLTACEHIAAAGLPIRGVYCVLDRVEGGRERLEAAGYELTALFTREELVRTGRGDQK
ncbi:MAG: orotate phosphoribosyltransferase, partial [Desulfohalobium sp.]